MAAASPGDTVVVCPGTYREDVVVGKAIRLVSHGATIDASGKDNAVQVLASGVTVEGFTATNAIGEGILVGALPENGPVVTFSGVTIRNNTVVNNDRSSSSYGQCLSEDGIPGDCGEGIHLMSIENSRVIGNRVSGNSGGILLSDENGPTAGNLIASNVVSGNLYDCGITVAGHRPQVFDGGIHDNTILGNRVTNNGVAGQGAGVLLASGVPGNIPGIPGIGGAVFNNLVEGNYVAGNGLAGVTVHSHSPGEDLNGNVIQGNAINTNNLDGDADFYPAVDMATTGVLVASAATPLSITVAHNLIMNNVYGIWLTASTVSAAGTSTNTFVNVTIPVGP